MWVQLLVPINIPLSISNATLFIISSFYFCIIFSSNLPFDWLDALIYLSAQIGTLQSLDTLYLNNNLLTQLPKHFSNLQNMVTLSFSNNKFEEFPEVVCELSRVVDINAEGNDGITSLPLSLKKMRSLTRLNLVPTQPYLLTTYPISIIYLPNCLRTLCLLPEHYE